MKDWQIRCIIVAVAPIGFVLSALDGARTEVRFFLGELSACWAHPQDTRWGKKR